jgi:hypothetical protein
MYKTHARDGEIKMRTYFVFYCVLDVLLKYLLSNVEAVDREDVFFKIDEERGQNPNPYNNCTIIDREPLSVLHALQKEQVEVVEALSKPSSLWYLPT